MLCYHNWHPFSNGGLKLSDEFPKGGFRKFEKREGYVKGGEEIF